MINDVLKKVMAGAAPGNAIQTSQAPGDYGAQPAVGATGATMQPGGGGMPNLGGFGGGTKISGPGGTNNVFGGIAGKAADKVQQQVGGFGGVGATKGPGIQPGGGGMGDPLAGFGGAAGNMISKGPKPGFGNPPNNMPTTQQPGFGTGKGQGVPSKHKPQVDKAMFMAVLHAALESAARAGQQFDLQAAIGDVQGKLGALTGNSQSMDKLHDVIDNSAQAQAELKRALESMHNVTKQIANALK
jgi:hypothetical protein